MIDALQQSQFLKRKHFKMSNLMKVNSYYCFDIRSLSVESTRINLELGNWDFQAIRDFLQVCVKMKNLENGTEFVWPKEKFLNRLYLMKEMYNNYEEEDDDWDLPEERDPFQVNRLKMSTTNLIRMHCNWIIPIAGRLKPRDYNRYRASVLTGNFISFHIRLFGYLKKSVKG